MDDRNTDSHQGRRHLLKLIGAAAAVVFSPTIAAAKSSKSATAYRNAPNGRQSCANCSWFSPPSGCGVVSGPVSARGWCNLWG